MHVWMKQQMHTKCWLENLMGGLGIDRRMTGCEVENWTELAQAKI
jgi:hypothetical protein